MSTQKHLVGLDGLRGAAALAVLMLHVVIYFGFSGQAGAIVNHGYLAVDAFYMISGFVIAHSFDPKMERGMPISRFFLSRVVRLYPMLVVGAIFGGATLASYSRLHPNISSSSLLTAGLMGLFLFPTRALIDFKPYLFPLNSSFWSLSFEFLLYAFYALTFPLLKHDRVRAVLLVISAGILLSLSIHAGGLDVGYRADDYVLGFARCLFSFLAGVALRRSRFYQPNSLHFGSAAVVVTVLLLCNPMAKSGFYDAVTVIVLLPLIVISAANAGKLSRCDLVSAGLGELSYPLYAIHYPIVVACSNGCKLLHLSLPARAGMALVCTGGTIGAAVLLERYYDRPLRTALATWTGLKPRYSAASREPLSDCWTANPLSHVERQLG